MAVRLRVILTVFLLTGAVVVASTLVTFLFGTRVLQVHAREQNRRDGIVRLDRIESSLKDAETGQRGFIITGDESYLQPFNSAAEHLPKEVEKLRDFPWVDVNVDEVSKIAQLTDQKMSELRRTIELRRSGGSDAAMPVIKEGSGKKLMDDVRVQTAQLRERQVKGLRDDAMLSDRTTRARTWVFILCAALNIGILAWAYQRIAEALKQRDIALHEASLRGFELQQQKDLLSTTLASIGDCVMVTDESGNITFMNSVAEQLTGWNLNEVMGRPTSEVFRILNEDTRQPVENPAEKVMRQGVIVGLANHTLLIRKDGTEVPIDDSGAPIRDRDGHIRGVVLVFRDFSEHKQAERELRIAKEEAESANKTKDQFLAMLSHELRTPLTPVLATLNLWEASEDIPESIRSDVQMLRRSIELEARIIDDLLDLTRIARGLLAFSPETTDVHAVVDFLVGLSQSELQSKALKIALKLDAPRHHVYTDAGRLQQVFWNILRNAIKFTDESGRITIKTTNNASGDIEITITDTGIGMTAETMSRLFVPFEQAEPTQYRRYGGLGLGMAISSALVDLLEGELRVESAGLGEGSTFTVRFPTTDPGAADIESKRAPAASRDKVRLLLVEDHVDTARALSRLLENRGYRIEAVSTVRAALTAIEGNSFDLLLCDLGLPDGTGIELIQKVRQNNQTPAIALTGFGMQEDVERAQRAGFNAHLTKPVNLQKLEATIWRLLQEHT